MTRILVFAGLLALPIVFGGICDDKDVLTEGSTMTLGAPEPTEKLIQCFITTNRGKKYELFPNNESPGSYDGDEKTCRIRSREIRMNYAGVWTMETVTETDTFHTNFTVKMKQTTISRPADYISIAAGQWATAWLDSDRDDLTFCSVTDPQEVIHNLMDDKVENITRIHGCGVRILVKREMKGQWTFCAQFGDYLITTALFEISIPKERKDNKIIQETWEIGGSGTLNINERGVIFCQFTRPDGVKLSLIFKSCFYEIPVVTSHHNGIWKAAYARADQLELTYVDINITTHKAANLLESSLITGVGREVNLMCRSRMKSMKFCIFIRPDKRVINVIAGLGNERYSYYGEGYQEDNSPGRRYSECGLTIHNPSKEDFGVWNCKISINETIRGAFINVPNTQTADQMIKVDSPKVFVKRGNDFKILCSTNAILTYCWVTSPNGTTYSVSSTGGTDKVLKYDGIGLSMGECGAIVERANDTDNGKWTCHLGIDHDGEVEATVAVKVTDTYLIATRDTVYAKREPTLSCRTFPDADETLRYCRWVRPNGHGINEEDASRYLLNKGISECALTILVLVPEDIGQWQCIASTTRDSNIEEWTIVDLKSVEEEMRITTIIAILLGCALIIVGIIATFYVGMHYWRKGEAELKKSSYCHQDYNISDRINSDLHPAIQGKKCLH